MSLGKEDKVLILVHGKDVRRITGTRERTKRTSNDGETWNIRREECHKRQVFPTRRIHISLPALSISSRSTIFIVPSPLQLTGQTSTKIFQLLGSVHQRPP